MQEIITISLTQMTQTDNLVKLQEIAAISNHIKSKSKSENTLNGYASDWADFEGWCDMHQLQALPATVHTVSAYLADRAVNSWCGVSGRLRKMIQKEPLKLPTLLHRVWGIKYKHKEHGFTFDSTCKEIADTLSGLRNINTAKEERKDPLVLKDIRKMSEGLQAAIDDKVANPVKARIAIRDRALLLIGFVSAMP